MQQIVEEAAKSTVNVMEKVNAATEEVGNNYELAGQLDNGFNNVKEAVEKGNEAVEEAKSTIASVKSTVGAAHKTTSELLTQMKKITDILGEINSMRHRLICYHSMRLLKRQEQVNTEKVLLLLRMKSVHYQKRVQSPLEIYRIY